MSAEISAAQAQRDKTGKDAHKATTRGGRTANPTGDVGTVSPHPVSAGESARGGETPAEDAAAGLVLDAHGSQSHAATSATTGTQAPPVVQDAQAGARAHGAERELLEHIDKARQYLLAIELAVRDGDYSEAVRAKALDTMTVLARTAVRLLTGTDDADAAGRRALRALDLAAGR